MPFLDLLPLLLKGLGVTVLVFVGAATVAALLSLGAGLARLSRFSPLRWLATGYIEVFRGTSALVQLFWFYYVLPLFGVEISALAVGIVVLGLNYGAYGAEVVRGAIASIPRGQTEAAIALNMRPLLRLRRVILPQAIVRMLPPMGNLQIELLKNTALVYFVSLHDLTYQGKILQNDTQRTFEIFGLILVLYFLLAQGANAATRAAEGWLGRGVRAGGAVR